MTFGCNKILLCAALCEIKNYDRPFEFRALRSIPIAERWERARRIILNLKYARARVRSTYACEKIDGNEAPMK